MLARIWSAALVGIDAVKVGVEVDVSGGLPKTVVLGLPDAAIQESKERVKAAIKNIKRTGIHINNGRTSAILREKNASIQKNANNEIPAKIPRNNSAAEEAK